MRATSDDPQSDRMDPPMPDAATSSRDQQYRAVFEASSDGFIINDLATSLVLEANPACCRMHGYEDMTGLHSTAFIHPNSHHLFEEYVRTIQAGGEYRCRAQDVRRDGSVLDVEVLGKPFTYRGRPAILGMVRDITEQARAYQILEDRVAERTREIERRRAVAEGLRDLLAVVNSQRTLDEILAYVVEQARRLLGSDASAIFLPVPGRTDQVLGIRASSGLEPEYANVLMPVSASSTGLAYSRRRPVVVADVRGALPPAAELVPEPVLEEWPDQIRVVRFPSLREDPERARPGASAGSLRAFSAGYGAFLAIPLTAKDEVYGTLSLYYRQPRDFSDDEVATASTFAGQAALAIENTRLRAQAQQAATLEERQRLARELHDAVTQTLFSTALIAEVIPDLWEVDPPEARRRIEQLRRLTRGALAEMRTLLVELRPGALTDLPLPDLLRQLGEAVAGRTHLELAVRVEGRRPGPLPPEVQVALYRIAQEALNNIAKHAQAGRATVLLRNAPDDGVVLQVSDDGRGFDPAAATPGHLGVGIMCERAAAIGAHLTVDSRPGGGTRIEVRWQDVGGTGP